MGRLARIGIEELEKQGRNLQLFGFISVYFDNSFSLILFIFCAKSCF